MKRDELLFTIGLFLGVLINIGVRFVMDWAMGGDAKDKRIQQLEEELHMMDEKVVEISRLYEEKLRRYSN